MKGIVYIIKIEQLLHKVLSDLIYFKHPVLCVSYLIRGHNNHRYGGTTQQRSSWVPLDVSFVPAQYQPIIGPWCDSVS